MLSEQRSGHPFFRQFQRVIFASSQTLIRLISKGCFASTKPPFVSSNALPFHSSRRGEAATRTRGIPYLAFGRRRRRRPVRAPRGTRASPLRSGRGGEPIGFSDAKTTSAAFRRSEGDDKLARRR